MTSIRKKHTTEFKIKVALEAIKQQKTVNELTAEHGVHATQINTWKKQVLETLPEAFSSKRDKAKQKVQGEIDELHRQIGQRVAERDWLKKRSAAVQ